MFDEGANAKQVQMRLGHHAASFTMDRYIHAVPGSLARRDRGNLKTGVRSRGPRVRIPPPPLAYCRASG